MFKFFKSAAEFKFLETSLPDINYIHDGMRTHHNWEVHITFNLKKILVLFLRFKNNV
jgi:hypothetical protein